MEPPIESYLLSAWDWNLKDPIRSEWFCWVVLSNIFDFHPYLGKNHIATNISNGLVQPPTSFGFFNGISVNSGLTTTSMLASRNRLLGRE